MTTDWLILGCIAVAFLLSSWWERRRENIEAGKKQRRYFCGDL